MVGESLAAATEVAGAQLPLWHFGLCFVHSQISAEAEPAGGLISCLPLSVTEDGSIKTTVLSYPYNERARDRVKSSDIYVDIG